MSEDTGTLDVKTDEWRAELDRLSQTALPDDPGRTTEEIGAALHMGITKTQRFLRRAVADGRVIRGKRRAQKYNGVWYLADVYRVKT